MLCLVPIAAAYLIAHNFANLLLQGQLLIKLISEPLVQNRDGERSAEAAQK